MPVSSVLLVGLLVAACAAPRPPTTSPGASPSAAPTQSASPSPTVPASPAPSEPASPPSGDGLGQIIGEWVLEEGTLDGDPIPRVADAPITLSINAVRIGGTSACNSYGADWVVTQDGSVDIDQITMTMMLCEGPINESEMAYLEALGRTDRVGLDGDTLVLTGEGMELRFVRADA